MFERAILHLDVDSFFASVEMRRNMSLTGKALVISGHGVQSVVASCSPEARRWGIHTGMPLRMVRRMCPEAIIIQGDMEAYQRESAIIEEMIQESVPVCERASLDAFYGDLTGMDKYFGCWRWSEELKQRIFRETHLPLSIGLAVNKLVARIGTLEARPNGARLIERGTERRFLSPLSVRKLPGVGEIISRKLNLMGIRQIGLLAALPPRLLEREFGKPGVQLWKKANAEDYSPVVPQQQQNTLQREQVLDKEETDPAILKRYLATYLGILCKQLRERRCLCTRIRVKIRYADFNTFSREKKVAPTCSDSTLEREAFSLLTILFDRRQGIRLLGIQLGGLVKGSPQLDLFDQGAKNIHLLKALDRIRNRFGDAALGMPIKDQEFK
jgi:DNA polymerase-4